MRKVLPWDQWAPLQQSPLKLSWRHTGNVACPENAPGVLQAIAEVISLSPHHSKQASTS